MWLLTRPLPKLQKSCNAFATAGIDVIGVAFSDIQPIEEHIHTLYQRLQRLSTNDSIIVTSVYAAQSVPQCPSTQPCHCFAVGKSTAKILSDKGWHVQTPAQESSEGLLSLSALAQGQQTQLLLLKGEGGRELLAPSLRERGFIVEVYDLYRRTQLPHPVLTAALHQQGWKGVICTSGESAAALLAWQPTAFTDLPWLTVSQRVADILHQHGIKTVEICESASDHAMISWITQQWT